MSDELIASGSAIVATEVPLVIPHVDEPPQLTPELQAEVDRLAKVKAQQLKREEFDDETKKAEEKSVYWRKEKARDRDEYFTGRGRGRVDPPVPTQPSELKLPEKPKREDFEDYDSFVEAVVDYKADLKIAKWREDDGKRTGQEEYQKKITALAEKLDEGYTLYPDFEEVAKDQSVPITMVVRDILAEIDHPAQVAYYLGKNRMEAIQIARMTPFKAHKEIMRIEAEIMKSPTPPVTKKVTGAPPPIKPGGSPDVLTKDVSKMTQKEYESWAKEKGMRDH